MQRLQAMMKTPPAPTDFTSLARPVDPRFSTNRIIGGLMVLGAVIGGVIGLITTGDMNIALNYALQLGIGGVFLTWALGREADPDYDYSAFMAAALAAVGIVLLGFPQIDYIGIFILMPFARIVNRTVGPPAKLTDSLLLLVPIIILIVMGNWQLLAVAVVAFVLDAVMRDGVRLHWVHAFVALVGIGIAVFTNRPIINDVTPSLTIIIAIVSLAYIGIVSITQEIRTLADIPTYEMTAGRVRAGMLIILGGALLPAFWGNGDADIIAYLPIWAIILSVPIYRALELSGLLNEPAKNDDKDKADEPTN